MERTLTDWEDAVVRALATVDVPGMDHARAAIDHLIVTGICECGCGSFTVQDSRQAGQPHQLHHVSNGVCGDIGLALFLGPDGKPIAVDVLLPDERTLVEHGFPDPEEMTVSRAQ